MHAHECLYQYLCVLVCVYEKASESEREREIEERESERGGDHWAEETQHAREAAT